jgi:AraC-like DNA-binding protein
MSRLALARHASALQSGLAPGTQRVGPLSELPGLLRGFDVRSSTVLRRVGLAADALADRDARVPYSMIASLLDACVSATGCQHFGLMAGSCWRLDHVGLPGEIAGACATVGEALETFTAYQWLNSSGGVAFLGRDEGVTTFGYAIFEPNLRVGIDQIHDMVMAVGVRMIRELAGTPGWSPMQVMLSRKRPESVAPYRRLFGAPIQFDADMTALHFPSGFEATHVRSGNETRRRVLEAKLLAAGREAMLPKLHRMIRVAMIFGLTSGDEVASAMSLTRRTFNRRLAEYGTTFQDVLKAVRHDVARQLLRETTLPVGEIGGALGYAEPSAFVRAFRQWTRSTPGAWREQSRTRAPR